MTLSVRTSILSHGLCLVVVVSRRFAHNFRISVARKTRQPAVRSREKSNDATAPQHQATDVRLGRIVRLLMEHATVVVSGTKIAQEISCSRSEVWRLIQQLRSLGVDVAGHPATGYQLRSVPDLPLPEIIRPMLRGTIFDGEIHHFYKIGSTNTAAMTAAAAGAQEGSVFLAEQQTAGRGRGANTWHSPRSSGIYCSVILRPALPPSDVLVLSLASGLAVHAAIRQIDSKISLDLKWPNDLLIDGNKVCGILTEMNSEATRVRFIVVGIGINVNQTSFPDGLEAISLQQTTGREWSRVELVASLLKSLDHEYREVVQNPGARESILRRFAENSSWVHGKSVMVTENGGSMQGITEGLDERGFLRLRTPSGLQTVLSGMVRAK
jgi:BirA family transcriptional regulator, biotin operon repressor / biotin---[acetyl-CoA-carboxylase] ligase